MKPIVGMVAIAVLVLAAVIVGAVLQTKPTAESVELFAYTSYGAADDELPIARTFEPSSSGSVTGISFVASASVSGNFRLTFFLTCGPLSNQRTVGTGRATVPLTVAPLWVTISRTSTWNATIAAGEDCTVRLESFAYEGGASSAHCSGPACTSGEYALVVWGVAAQDAPGTDPGDPAPGPGNTPPPPDDGDFCTSNPNDPACEPPDDGDEFDPMLVAIGVVVAIVGAILLVLAVRK